MSLLFSCFFTYLLRPHLVIKHKISIGTCAFFAPKEAWCCSWVRHGIEWHGRSGKTRPAHVNQLCKMTLPPSRPWAWIVSKKDTIPHIYFPLFFFSGSRLASILYHLERVCSLRQSRPRMAPTEAAACKAVGECE